MNQRNRFMALGLGAGLVVSVAGIGIPNASALGGQLVVDNTGLGEQSTSLTLPTGSQQYLFGYVTGGAFPSGDFSTGQTASVTDPDSYESAALAVTAQNSDSYSTQTAYHVIGGVGVSNYSTLTAFYGKNPGPGQPPNASTGWTLSASVSFSVSVPGSLVVIMGMGSSQEAISLTGVPQLDQDRSSTVEAIEIAHAYPSVGTYTATANTTATSAGQDPYHAADLIGAFVFTPPPGPTVSIAPESELLTITNSVEPTVTVQFNGSTAPVRLSFTCKDASSTPCVDANGNQLQIPPGVNSNGPGLLVNPPANGQDAVAVPIDFSAGKTAISGTYTISIVGNTSDSTTPAALLYLTVSPVTGVANSLTISPGAFSDSGGICPTALASCLLIQQNSFVSLPKSSQFKDYWVQNVVFVGPASQTSAFTSRSITPNNDWLAKDTYQVFAVDSNGNDGSLPVAGTDCIGSHGSVCFPAGLLFDSRGWVDIGTPSSWFDSAFVLHSTIAANGLNLDASFGSLSLGLAHDSVVTSSSGAYIVGGFFGPDVPELVITGPPKGGAATFSSPTTGTTGSCFATTEVPGWIGRMSSASLLKGQTSTAEYANNLSWQNAGSFHYQDGANGQGIAAIPDGSFSACPGS